MTAILSSPITTVAILVACLAFIAVCARRVWLDTYAGVQYHEHAPRPTMLVSVEARPHLYDWERDDFLVEIR